MSVPMSRYLSILNLLFLTAAVYLGVGLFYKIITGDLHSRSPLQRSLSKTPVPAVKNYPVLDHYKSVVERNLFKTGVQASKEIASIKIEKIKPTGLKLKLWGTVADEEHRGVKAYAVIEEEGKGKQHLFREGDKIQRATIKSILRRKVVLNVDGKDEMLEMEQMKDDPRSPKAHRPAIPKSSEGIRLKRSQMDDAVKDVNQLLQQVRIMPHFQNGKPDGLSFTNIKPNSIFAKMGLRNGDVILGVDDQQIETVDDALALYERLKSTEHVRLRIKRQGRHKTIEYDIE